MHSKEPEKKNDWRKLLMTDEEYEKYMHANFVIDPDDGDILARRLSPREQALLNGIDWYAGLEDYTDFDEDCVMEVPESMLVKREDDDGICR